MNENIETFCKDWRIELRRRVQETGKTAKRKPFMDIVHIEGVPDSGMMGYCKEIGIVGGYYDIPLDSGINSQALLQIWLHAGGDEMYIEEPLPEGFKHPAVMGNLKSQNVDPHFAQIVAEMLGDGFQLTVKDLKISNEDLDLLTKMAVLDRCIRIWENDNI